MHPSSFPAVSPSLAFWLASLCSTATQAQITVAQVAPFSGGISAYAEELRLGASVLFDAVNAQGGINGQKIRLVTCDDEQSPAKTILCFEQLAREQHPVAMLFPVGPLGITALLKQGLPQKWSIPVVGTIPSMYKLRTPVNPFVFHLGLGDDAELERIVTHIATMGQRKLGVVLWYEPSALDALAVIRKHARAQGVDIVMTAPVPPGTAKIDDAVASILRAKPGAVIAVLPVHATGALVKRLRTAGNQTPLYGLSYTEASYLINTSGAPSARGFGVSQVVPNPYSPRRALVRDYQRDMRLHAPNESRPSTLSLQGYIGARIVLEGLRRSAPPYTSIKVRNAIEALRNLDLGDLTIDFSPSQHVGLKYLDIGVISEGGQLRY